MGKKGVHNEGDVIEDDVLGGVRVINGRVQATTTTPTDPQGPANQPIVIENGVPSHGEAEVTNTGALKVVQG